MQCNPDGCVLGKYRRQGFGTGFYLVVSGDCRSQGIKTVLWMGNGVQVWDAFGVGGRQGIGVRGGSLPGVPGLAGRVVW